MIEVIYGILNCMDVTIERFEEIRKRKQEERGAFNNKMYLEEVE